MRFAGFLVKLNAHSAQEAIPLGFLESHGSPEPQTIHGGLYLNAQAGELRTCHSGVSDIRCVTAEYRLVSGLDVGVSSENSADLPGEIVTHRLFFGGRLSMEVQKNIGSFNAGKKLVYLCERIVKGIHVHRSHKVDESHGICAHIQYAYAFSRSCALRIIGRAEDKLVLKKAHGFFSVKGVIAGSYQVCAGVEYHIGGGRSDTVALSGIFAVDYSDVRPVVSAELTQLRAEKVAASLADYIADEKECFQNYRHLIN